MFRHTLKKRQKLDALLALLKPAGGRRCLLVTCGDNNGALNWHFKQHGGAWAWADAEPESRALIAELTDDPVAAVDKAAPRLAFPDDAFDALITIDVHEHLERPALLNAELARLVRPGGVVIVTTPNGDEGKPANRIKRLLGMRPADYGHIVAGYSATELSQQLTAAGLEPYASASYARFFTEMVELTINVAYVKLLGRRGRAKARQGQIAPQSKGQIESVNKSYRMYARLYPLMRAIARLDWLDRSSWGYAVIVAARKG